MSVTSYTPHICIYWSGRLEGALEGCMACAVDKLTTQPHPQQLSNRKKHPTSVQHQLLITGL